MRYISRLSLKFKFAVLVMVFVTTFLLYGVYSIYQNNSILTVTNTIYNHPLEVSNASRKAGLNIIKMHLLHGGTHIYQMTMSPPSPFVKCSVIATAIFFREGPTFIFVSRRSKTKFQKKKFTFYFE